MFMLLDFKMILARKLGSVTVFCRYFAYRLWLLITRVTKTRPILMQSNYGWAFNYLKDPKGLSLALEIGSRDAIDAVAIAQRFECAVIAFEPVPANYRDCQLNIEKYPELPIILDNRCLSDHSGEIEFLAINPSLYDNPGASSMFYIDFENRPSDDTFMSMRKIQDIIKVEAVRFDHTNYTSPHSIFMDVQGSELLVLKGFGMKLLDVSNIVLETCLVSAYKGGVTFWELDNFLSSYGFTYQISTAFGRLKPPRIFPNFYLGEFDVLYSK